MATLIGQKKLINDISTLVNNGVFPKFSIIVGGEGSGKRTLIKEYISKPLGMQIIPFGTGIDDVRKIIELSYEQDKPICYVCANADDMSIGAKNALLKITEEPPKNAYFVLSLCSLSGTLETIKSRATIFTLDDYSLDELIEYRKFKKYSDRYDKTVIKDACTTTGEIDQLFKMDVQKFYDYAKLVAFSIQIPTSGNIFIIPKFLKLTSSSSGTNTEGFEPILLFKLVRNMYIKRGVEEKNAKYLYAAQVTSECLRDLINLSTVSKVGTIDKWIMDVRKVLR